MYDRRSIKSLTVRSKAGLLADDGSGVNNNCTYPQGTSDDLVDLEHIEYRNRYERRGRAPLQRGKVRSSIPTGAPGLALSVILDTRELDLLFVSRHASHVYMLTRPASIGGQQPHFGPPGWAFSSKADYSRESAGFGEIPRLNLSTVVVFFVVFPLLVFILIEIVATHFGVLEFSIIDIVAACGSSSTLNTRHPVTNVAGTTPLLVPPSRSSLSKPERRTVLNVKDPIR